MTANVKTNHLTNQPPEF